MIESYILIRVVLISVKTPYLLILHRWRKFATPCFWGPGHPPSFQEDSDNIQSRNWRLQLEALSWDTSLRFFSPIRKKGEADASLSVLWSCHLLQILCNSPFEILEWLSKIYICACAMSGIQVNWQLYKELTLELENLLYFCVWLGWNLCTYYLLLVRLS